MSLRDTLLVLVALVSIVSAIYFYLKYKNIAASRRDGHNFSKFIDTRENLDAEFKALIDQAPVNELVINDLTARIALRADTEERLRLHRALTGEYAAWKVADVNGLDDYTEAGSLVALAAGAVGFIVFIVWGITSQAFLQTISSVDGARGLLTFLFASTTTGIIVLIAVSTFWMSREDVEKRFPFGKDLLAITIGVLGTILGFYYGSAGVGSQMVRPLAISELNWTKEPVVSGTKTSISGAVIGGASPYVIDLSYQVLQGVPAIAKELPITATVNGSKFVAEFTAPAIIDPQALVGFTITAKDKSGASIVSSGGAIRIQKP